MKSSSLAPTAKALASLSNLFEKDVKLVALLAAPTLTTEDKSAIVSELVKQTGSGSGETVKNFLNTLAENNRLGILQGVCDKFGTLMSASKGEVEMVITSAQVRRLAGMGMMNNLELSLLTSYGAMNVGRAVRESGP